MTAPFFQQTPGRGMTPRETSSLGASTEILPRPSTSRSSNRKGGRLLARRRPPGATTRVHKANGYPSVEGFWSASAMSAERTASLWVRGRPERRRSSSPARPSSLKRPVHLAPTALLSPARTPASVAERSGSSITPAMMRARCTRRIGTVYERTRRRISCSSSRAIGRNVTRFDMASLLHLRGIDD